MSTKKRINERRDDADDDDAWPEWLTRIAFVLSLAIVVARATMMETLRDPTEVLPGGPAIPRGVGPATSLLLDLLAWVPALLVLARAAFDRAFRLRTTGAHLLFGALAAWAILSPLWASDRFAAVVSAFHLLSAAVFLWSASQLVTLWRGLRVVGGVCVGLLLLHGAQAMNYRFVDRPQIRQDWEDNREQRLRERGLEPGSFAAQQFEAKLLRGELMGFHASPNSFAAVTVLLMVVAAGVVVQRLVDRDGIGAAVVPVAGMLLGFLIIRWVDSKTAFATPLVAACILAAAAVAGGWMARRARLLYSVGVVAFVAGAAAYVAHGRFHGSFPIDSLTFRWHYWIGAARVFADHPILGVGWENFGLHYLAARLPVAAEEVRDPHNFLVRFATELGLVGGMLCVAWMMRLWWELTTPAGPTDEAKAAPRRALPAILAVVAAAVVLSITAAVDFGHMSVDPAAGPAYVTLRVLERVFAALILTAGIAVACVRSLTNPVLDDRAAPWLLRAAVAALAVFLLHNLVDFAMFETGPMFLFSLLAGAVIGVRTAGRADDDGGRPATSSRRLPIALAALGVAWGAAAVALALPVLVAEDRAQAGDENVREGKFAEAGAAYASALAAVPYNAEYAYAAARVAGSIDATRAAFDRAVQASPVSAGYRFAQGTFEAGTSPADRARVTSTFDAGLALDPANVPMRLRYAEALERLGLPAEARAQYEKALAYDDQLEPVEVERLSPEKVAEIRAVIARLASTSSPATTATTAPSAQ